MSDGKRTGKRHCCVAECDNDERYPERLVIRGHVDKNSLTWHRIPKGDAVVEKRKAWVKRIQKGRANFDDNPGSGTFVCSNHFRDGKPTSNNPYPSLFLTLDDVRHQPSPKKRTSPRKRKLFTPPSSTKKAKSTCETSTASLDRANSSSSSTEKQGESGNLYVAMKFAHITREYDVRFFTGLPGTQAFRDIFNMLKRKALVMQYWTGPKQTVIKSKDKIDELFDLGELDTTLFVETRKGRPRALELEQEFLLTLMKFRLATLDDDLAHRFKVSSTRVSQVFITWTKLMSKELRSLIIWPSRGQISLTLPRCFKRHYKKLRVIIDCSEVFIETPSSLEVQAAVWSKYKHHCTFKFLVAITPNGAISWLSPAYGGRASDKFIVKDSGFLDLLEPFDLVMADRGFKIKTDLVLKQCHLAIPPSAAKGTQMTAADVKETSRIANVRIFVEKAIQRMKVFKILSTTLPLLWMPLYDDIINICGALVNLLPPLTE